VKLFRLSPRLRFALVWPLVAAVGVAVPLIWFLVSGPLEQGTATLLLDTVEILRPQAVRALDQGGSRTQEAVRNLAATSAIRVTLINGSGRVIAESSLTWEETQRMENHGARPEVQAAFDAGRGTAVRHSATTGMSYAYAATRFTARDGRTYVLRLARPLEHVRFLRRNLAGALLLALATAVVLLGPISWWLNRTLFRPLRQIISGADRLAAGELRSRVAVPEAQELATLATGLNRLADEVETQLRLLGTERDHLREILASMSEGVLVTDAEGRVRLTNSVFRKIFSVDVDAGDRPTVELVEQPVVAELISATLDGQRPRSAELDLVEPRRHLSLIASPLPEQRGVVVVVRDVTTELRLAEARRDLVANVSHELKTPLTAIRGYAETLEDGALADSMAGPRFIRGILEQCQRLEALLRDQLTLSQLERLDPSRGEEIIDLTRAAARAVEALTLRARARDVELILETGNTAPQVRGTCSEIDNVLLNLIDNAIKYNRAGGEVRVALRGDGEDAVIEVADTGIGIPQDALERVFERFYRVDKGRAREQGGTGLGLAIVKHAARLLGGRIEVESRLGTGSVFRVRLPGAVTSSDP
jgi:two-component system phosphate regulon sensor histidine kinase PhoR